MSSSQIPSQSGTGSGAGSATGSGIGMRCQESLISTKSSKIRKPRTKVETNVQLSLFVNVLIAATLQLE
jgi:hypothetical protein